MVPGPAGCPRNALVEATFATITDERWEAAPRSRHHGDLPPTQAHALVDWQDYLPLRDGKSLRLYRQAGSCRRRPPPARDGTRADHAGRDNHGALAEGDTPARASVQVWSDFPATRRPPGHGHGGHGSGACPSHGGGYRAMPAALWHRVAVQGNHNAST